MPNTPTTESARAYARQLLRDCPPIDGAYSTERVELLLRVAFIDGQAALLREHAASLEARIGQQVAA